MLFGLGNFITAEVSGAVRRNLTIYGLQGLAGLLIVCAAGYGLDALHTLLSERLGRVAASLWIGGGLLACAIAALVAASMVRNRKRPARPIAQTALVAAPLAMRIFGSKVGWKAGLAGAAVILAAVLGRQALRGDDDAGDEDA